MSVKKEAAKDAARWIVTEKNYQALSDEIARKTERMDGYYELFMEAYNTPVVIKNVIIKPSHLIVAGIIGAVIYREVQKSKTKNKG